MELYYRRSESTHKGKNIPARVETVVLFLPDVWSCLPTRLEWDGLQQTYRKQLERKLKCDHQQEVNGSGCGGGEGGNGGGASSTGGGGGVGGSDETPPSDEKASKLFFFPKLYVQMNRLGIHTLWGSGGQ